MKLVETFKHWIECIVEFDDIKNEYDELMITNSVNTEHVENLQDKVQLLQAEINKNKALNKLIKELESQFDKANIMHPCRSLPSKKDMFKVPINVFITPNDQNIINDLKKWKLYNTQESRETLVPKIYSKVFATYYKYFTDIKNFGLSEMWLFPFEVIYLRTKTKSGADCEDWSHLLSSYYEAAGVHPAFYRCVTGYTNIIVNGKRMGHGTVYVHSPITNKFHHTNSTYGSIFDTLSEFPTHADATNGKDKIGIYKEGIWFSYNSKSCFYKFNPDQVTTLINKFNIKKI